MYWFYSFGRTEDWRRRDGRRDRRTDRGSRRRRQDTKGRTDRWRTTTKGRTTTTVPTTGRTRRGGRTIYIAPKFQVQHWDQSSKAEVNRRTQRDGTDTTERDDWTRTDIPRRLATINKTFPVDCARSQPKQNNSKTNKAWIRSLCFFKCWVSN